MPGQRVKAIMSNRHKAIPRACNSKVVKEEVLNARTAPLEEGTL